MKKNYFYLAITSVLAIVSSFIIINLNDNPKPFVSAQEIESMNEQQKVD